MRTLMLLAVAVLLVGCGSGEPEEPRTSPIPSALGGPAPSTAAVPAGHMDSLEKPVAKRLAGQIAGHGLHLQWLDCPRWDGTVPHRLTCTAYVDGLAARARVRLHAERGSHDVTFDASLLDAVVSTRTLERAVRGASGTGADCGTRAAYPAKRGLEIVCRVTRTGATRYVVATVRDEKGHVSIAAYTGPR